MPKAGDSYRVKLLDAHFKWGVHRNTNTRDRISGEGYIKIPKEYARKFDIFNSNHANANNLYTCSSSDGFLNKVTLKACGSSSAGDEYAKQFEGNGDLKLLGTWFHHIAAKVGDEIEVVWSSSTALIITKI